MKIRIEIYGGGLVELYQNTFVNQIFSYDSIFSGRFQFRNKKFRTTCRLPNSKELEFVSED